MSTIFARREFHNLTIKYISQNLAIFKTILASYYQTLNKLKIAAHKNPIYRIYECIITCQYNEVNDTFEPKT